MFQINAFYRKNISPFVKGVIEDYLDLSESNVAPDARELSFASQQEILGLLWEYDDRNIDVFCNDNFEAAVLFFLKNNSREDKIELAQETQEALFKYYESTINEILNHEFEGVYNEHTERLREHYQIDQEC